MATGRLVVFSFPSFRRLWLATLGYALSFWVERVAIGWFVFDFTGSIFLTTLAFAAQNMSNMLFGPIAGAAADRIDRARLLALTGYSGGGVALAMALLVVVNPGLIWPLIVLSGARGIARTFEIPAVQALMTDIVGSRHSTNAVGIYLFGLRSVAVVGGLAAGLLIEYVSSASAFVVAGAAAVAGGFLVRTVSVPSPKIRQPSPRPLLSDLVAGLRAMLASRIVRTLLGLTLLVEIFAFSYNSLLPAVAHDVFEVGPSGLGTLTLFAGLGTVGGSLILATIGGVRRRGRILMAVTFSYGGFLLLLAAADRFVLALAVIAGIGAMAALFDGLQWVLLQANVAPEMRGRAVGGWVWAIGLGWVGPLILGGIGEALGVPAAISLGGAAVMLAAVIALVAIPALREA